MLSAISAGVYLEMGAGLGEVACVPQRARPHKVELAFRRALRSGGGAGLLAAAIREDILVRVGATLAKSPVEVERRLPA